MTAQDLITSAYRKLNLVQPGGSPSSDESSTGLACLQQMLSAWNGALAKAVSGMYPASLVLFTPMQVFVALSDSVTIDASLVKTVIYNLAVELATELGRPVPEVVAAIAGQSKLNLTTVPNVI